MTRCLRKKIFLQIALVPNDKMPANVTAIYKKKDRKCASKYRPINLTSVADKIVQRTLKDKLLISLKID